MPDSVLDQLKDARKNLSWVTTARLFRTGQEGDPRQRTDFERKAAAVSGYSLGILKRFLTVLKFLESREVSVIAVRPDVIDSSFTKLELIERLHRDHAGKAIEWLGKLGQRGVRVAAIKKDLDDIREARAKAMIGFSSVQARAAEPRIAHRSFAASARGWRGDKMMDQVSELLPKLSGKIELFHTPFGKNSGPIRCDAIAWLDQDYTRADGYEFVFAPQTTTNSQFADQMSRVVLASTLFRRHWMVFSDDSSAEFPHRALSALKLLKVNTVGVVFLGGEKSKRILNMPSNEPPKPDRRDLLPKLCPGGRWTS
jgi:hypothetical protein